MIIRTLAASTLALGLLIPVAFAEDNSTFCSSGEGRRADYIECLNVRPSDSTDYNTFSVPNPTGGPRVGEFVDESPEDSRERNN
jgi:hypothetical protein